MSDKLVFGMSKIDGEGSKPGPVGSTGAIPLETRGGMKQREMWTLTGSISRRNRTIRTHPGRHYSPRCSGATVSSSNTRPSLTSIAPSASVRRYPHPSYPLTLNPARVSGTRLRARVDCRIRRGLLSRSRILGMVCRPHALSSHCGDLLFSTWMKDRFTDDIQTRQYRYPEGIQGAKWGTSVDIWSVACVVSPVPTPLPIGLLLTILCSRFSS